MKAMAMMLALLVWVSSSEVQARSDDRRSEQAMCERYKERLAKYRREGVMGIDPRTGRVMRMSRQQEQETIRDTEQSVGILCSTTGRVR